MSKDRNGGRRSGGNGRQRFSHPVRDNSGPVSKEIIVNVSNRETRMALLEDGKLMEYRVEREERVVGSIYKGIVQNVLPGMDAAFVDIGLERNAYLSVADILPEEGEKDPSPAGTRRSELRRRKIKELLRPGQQIMVQVTKGPRGTKGARVSSRIALPGRYVVLMPEGGSVVRFHPLRDAAGLANAVTALLADYPHAADRGAWATGQVGRHGRRTMIAGYLRLLAAPGRSRAL